MNEYDAHEILQLLVGELVYKNQLLREAVASKDQTINLIVSQLAATTSSTCACGVGKQLGLIRDIVKAQDLDFAGHRNCCFDEYGEIVPQSAKVS